MTAPKVPTGPIKRREMTKLRDRVGELRDRAEAIAGNLDVSEPPQGGGQALEARKLAVDLSELWTDLDRLDLRFKIHHDKAQPKKPKPVPQSELDEANRRAAESMRG